MTTLRSQLIHLAHAKPHLRPHLLPILAGTRMPREAKDKGILQRLFTKYKEDHTTVKTPPKFLVEKARKMEQGGAKDDPKKDDPKKDDPKTKTKKFNPDNVVRNLWLIGENKIPDIIENAPGTNNRSWDSIPPKEKTKILDTPLEPQAKTTFQNARKDIEKELQDFEEKALPKGPAYKETREKAQKARKDFESIAEPKTYRDLRTFKKELAKTQETVSNMNRTAALRKSLIRLANEKPHLRTHLIPLLRQEKKPTTHQTS